ncbi:hypothetical protein J5N97_009796 [Dioscorea zingiberensis]|uniref:Uncharacterized protein n=1 Tax=Dioscorea zingiberensis TaxID=325984 RepID=A0A9D5HM83_9LILI|nr:hypothetical protein J5N97_009796 [Dioscorea zingiberensis]
MSRRRATHLSSPSWRILPCSGPDDSEATTSIHGQLERHSTLRRSEASSSSARERKRQSQGRSCRRIEPTLEFIRLR